MISELTIEEESLLEKNLVWIFGSPRSGTTWLSGKLLVKNFHHLGEPLLGMHLSHERELGSVYVRDFDEHQQRENYFFSSKYFEITKYFLRKLILNRIHSQFQDLETLIIIKEPNGSMAADIISDCLPLSRIISLLRDGRDVLNSQITAMSEGGYVTKLESRFEPLSGQRRQNSIKTHSMKWVKLMEVLHFAHEHHDSDKKLLIHYEDLRSNTFELLKKIYSFLKVEINDKELQKIIRRNDFDTLDSSKKGIGTTRQFASGGKWKETFSKKEIEIFSNIMNHTLKKLGYVD